MTTWTGTRDSSRRFCTRVAGPCGPLLHSLRDGGASRSAPRACSLIIVLHPATRARNAAVRRLVTDGYHILKRSRTRTRRYLKSALGCLPCSFTRPPGCVVDTL